MRLPVVLGPTAVGKTELAVRVVSSLGAEIISADSRQVYRYMDIGTAKPGRTELHAARHHMIDIVDPDESFGAGQYGTTARKVVARLIEEGQAPLVVGGSGLYIRALIEGFFPAPPVDRVLRERILNLAEERGSKFLHRRLGEVDPESADRIHPNDLQRISRALEVYEQTGKPISWLQGGSKTQHFEPAYIGLTRDRSELLERIDSRVDEMLRMGFLEEVRHLIEKGYSPKLNSFRAVGYREMSDHLSHNTTLVEAVARIKKSTKAFARRQLTWFRGLADVEWIDLSEREMSEAVKSVCSLVQGCRADS